MMAIRIENNVKETHKSIFDSKTYDVDGFATSLLLHYSPCLILKG